MIDEPQELMSSAWERRVAMAALVLGAGLVCWPLLGVTYPPLTDLPFHAAQTAIFAHYGDPAWHFAEQFALRPVAVPQLALYLLGVAFGWVSSPAAAAKAVVAVSIASLPIGLAVLRRGAGRSPLLGLAGLVLGWGTLVHWGFVSFVAALGLEAAAVGVALLVVEKPTLGRRIVLGVLLALTFFTHPSRLPFALAGVAIVALVVARSLPKAIVLLEPFSVGVLLFVIWRPFRPAELTLSFGDLGFEPSRLLEAEHYLIGTYEDGTPTRALEHASTLAVLAATAVLVVGALVLRARDPDARERASSGRRATLAIALVAGMHLLAFVILPMRAGGWWYVYPREITAAVLFGLALLPDLPSLPGKPRIRLALALPLVVACTWQTAIVARQWRAFEAVTADFRRILERVPAAPRLCYLMFDLRGTDREIPPFVHLPAWVQAERGGWLSFHFVDWGLYPVRYREGPARPPRVPDRWEFHPEYFRVLEHGAFFDTFLVRIEGDPTSLFAGDPSIRFVAHEGTWWLFQRAVAADSREHVAPER